MPQSRVWHPFTQHALEHSIPEIVRTEGAYLHKADGARILDAISSWWVVTHGHRHPRIMKAHEPCLPWVQLAPELQALFQAAQISDVAAIKTILQRHVQGFQPS